MNTKPCHQRLAVAASSRRLEDRFTVADLLMTTVLRILRHIDLVTQMPTLEAYRLRCETRPAFKKALAAQMADFSDKASAA
jgi:glutathione S-transferase